MRLKPYLQGKQYFKRTSFQLSGPEFKHEYKKTQSRSRKICWNVIWKSKKVFWHDVTNNSISRHKNNGFWSLSVLELITILKTLRKTLRALVYNQRDRTPNFVEEMKKENNTVLHVKRILFHLESKKIKNLWNSSVYNIWVVTLNWNIYIFCSTTTVILIQHALNVLPSSPKKHWKTLRPWF